MPNSDFTVDADIIFEYPDLIEEFKETISRVRKRKWRRRLINLEFYKSVIPLFEEFEVDHSYKADRKSQYKDKGREIFYAVQSGLNPGKDKSGIKFGGALLAWLSYHAPNEAQNLYDKVYLYYEGIGELDALKDFAFREYQDQPKAFEDRIVKTSSEFSLLVFFTKIQDAIKAVRENATLAKRWAIVTATLTGVTMFLTLVAAPMTYDYWFKKNETACGKLIQGIDSGSAASPVFDYHNVSKRCGAVVAEIIRSSATSEYVAPKAQAAALEDYIIAYKRNDRASSTVLASLYFKKSENEFFFNRAKALDSLKTAIKLSPKFQEAKIIKDNLARNLGIESEILPIKEFVELVESQSNNTNSPIVRVTKLFLPFREVDLSSIDLSSDQGKIIVNAFDDTFEELQLLTGFMAISQRYGLAEIFYEEFDDERYVLSLLEQTNYCEAVSSKKEKALCVDLMYTTVNFPQIDTNYQTVEEIRDDQFLKVEKALSEAGLTNQHAELLFKRARYSWVRNVSDENDRNHWRQQEKLLRQAVAILGDEGDPFLEAQILRHLGLNVISFHKQDQRDAYYLLKRASDLYYENGMEADYLRVAASNAWREAKYGSVQRAYDELKLALQTLVYHPTGRAEDEVRLASFAAQLGKAEESKNLREKNDKVITDQFATLSTIDEVLAKAEKLNRNGRYDLTKKLLDKSDLMHLNSNMSIDRLMRLATILLDFRRATEIHIFENNLEVSPEWSLWKSKNLPQAYDEVIRNWDALSTEGKANPVNQERYVDLQNAWSNYNLAAFRDIDQMEELTLSIFYQALHLHKAQLSVDASTDIETLISQSAKEISTNSIDQYTNSFLGLALSQGREYLMIRLHPTFAVSGETLERVVAEESEIQSKAKQHIQPLLEASYDPHRSFAPPFLIAFILQQLEFEKKDYSNSIKYSNDLISAYERLNYPNSQFHESAMRHGLMIRAGAYMRTCQEIQMAQSLNLTNTLLPERKISNDMQALFFEYAAKIRKNGCSLEGIK